MVIKSVLFLIGHIHKTSLCFLEENIQQNDKQSKCCYIIGYSSIQAIDTLKSLNVSLSSKNYSTNMYYFFVRPISR